MPEIKNNFTQGKMNQDLDERVIPKGQYREALNIEISTSEGSDVGTVQNILGNARVESVIGGGWNCVGAISDEKKNRFFWFVHNPGRDAIFEYNTDTNTTTPVIIDTSMNVLRFQGNIITAINIIDDILLWTDNHNKPRKINVERCKLGADATNPISTHTKLVVNNIVTSDDIKEENITVIKKRPSHAPVVSIERTVGLTPSLGTASLSKDNFGNFLAVKGDIIRFYAPRIIVGLIAYPSFFATIGDKVSLSAANSAGSLPANATVSGEITNVSTQVGNPGWSEFEIEVIEILASLSPAAVDVSNTDAVAGGVEMNILLTQDTDTTIFTEKLVRFATRWKYEDGEHSAFSPFSQPAFLARPFSFHPTKDTFNRGMENDCQVIGLSKLVPPNAPKDVVQVDILFKLDNSTTVYSIDSLKRNDPGGSSNNFNSPAPSTMILSPDVQSVPFDTSGGYTGVYTISTENIYAALPSNQLLRPWDNVPKKALAQEITGNRVVYANYTQGYNMVDGGQVLKPTISVGYRQRSYLDNSILDFSKGRKSLKTFKNYQVGVVYGDEYGRETPVFTSQNASLKIPWDSDDTSDFAGNAARSNQLTAILGGNQPPWADYYKFFVKETSGEYYNLAMDKVYRSEDGENLWISFPSSDANKVQKEDYIILKKKVNINEQIPIDNKYKVIDIKNEAPDFIKFDPESIGNVGGQASTVQDLYVGYNTGVNIPEVAQSIIEIKKSVWENEGGTELKSVTEPLELIFTKRIGVSILQSQTYSVVSVSLANNNANYKITLSESISTNDSWVISDTSLVTIEPTLRLKINRKRPKDGNEFSGRFFVKIILDLMAKQFLESSIITNITYRNSLSISPFYLIDTPTAAPGASAADGVVNVTNGRLTSTGDVNLDVHGEAKSNTRSAWETLYEFGNSTTTPSFFIDQSYFASVQPIDGSDVTGQTGNLNCGISGRLIRGSGGTTGQYFIDSIEGIIDTEDSNRYNVGAAVTSDSGWGGRQWTTQSRGQNNGVSFANGNEIDPVYTDRYYMHLSFGPVGDPLWTSVYQANGGGNTGDLFSTNDLFWRHINPGRLATDYPADGTSSFNNSVENQTLNYPGGDRYAAQSSSSHNPYFEDSNSVPNPIYADQWKIKDPDNAKLADNILPNAQFKIEGFDEVFTIQAVSVKRLYNHTPFMRTQNAWDGTTDVHRDPRSVENRYAEYISYINSNNSFATDPTNITQVANLIEALENFGDPSNRRLLYILELDKDPRDYITTSEFTFDANTSQMIRFVEPVVKTENVEVVNPAIWETEAKEETDLNIYYEASDAIPTKTNEFKSNSEVFAPIGSQVWCSKIDSVPQLTNSLITTPLIITDWEANTSNGRYNVVEIASPGLNIIGTNNTLAGQTAEYQGKSLRFFKPDGSFVSAKIYAVKEIHGTTNQFITKLSIYHFHSDRKIGLSYYDCFSFGNGVESDRIRDDFNAMSISNGVKASSVLQESYQEENRKNGLIYSGIYNSVGGVNNLNQFIQAEKITKDLNPTYGSIQKLFQRRIDLVSLCEDRVVKILSNKDALFNADGNAQLVATNKVLGEANPFVGDYGISTDPASFAKESYRAYFTDRQRGAVLRLSMDGITPISEAGMSTYFKDTLTGAENVISSYDTYKGEYNLTIDNTTLSYSEKVKGWVSFKSFIPEFGLSSSNGYYTFDLSLIHI